MGEIHDVGPELVGRTVQNAARRDWGTGQVLRVQSSTTAGQTVHRVSIQFTTGHRTLLIPPARLIEPSPNDEPAAPAGWLDRIAGDTPDDRLRRLPDSATQVLGTLAERVAALAPYYACDDDTVDLVRWARRLTGIADPLTRWSRDALETAYGQFIQNRDQYLARIVSDARRARGPGVVEEALEAVADDVRARMRPRL